MVEHVSGISSAGSMQAVRRANKLPYVMDQQPVQADSVAINNDVMKLRGVEGIRFDRVLAVQQQIAAEGDAYWSAEKLDAALDRALDDAIGQLFSGR